MPRSPATVLTIAAAALAAANVLAYLELRAPAARPEPGSIGQRWQALSAAEQGRYIRQFQALAGREDAAAILGHAREFASLPARRRERLRSVAQAVADARAGLVPARRRDLLRSPPGARAYFVYQALLTDDPERLARLAVLCAEVLDDAPGSLERGGPSSAPVGAAPRAASGPATEPALHGTAPDQ